MKYLFFIALLLAGAQSSLAKHYVSGLQKVTFRAGPGVENKIIRMVETDSAMTILQKGDEWSKVKDKTGKEGYVMTRFLSKEVPYSLKYSWLKGQNEKLKKELQELKDLQENLNQNFTETKRELASTKENLETTNSSFAELKNGSQEYLKLKAKYEAASSALSGQNEQVKALREKLSLYYFTWFVAGAGVLLLGWLIGFLSRKSKKTYSGISL